MSVKAQLYINSAEHQPQSAQRKHIWRSCISTAMESLEPCRFGRHSRVDQSGIPTAISRKKHICRRCMSPARYSCTSIGIKDLKRSRSGRYGRVEQSGISTAISKAETHLRQMYVTSVVYLYSSSNQNLKRKHYYQMQPCRPERYINHDQQNKSTSGTVVYIQRGISTAISRAEAYLVQMHVTRAV